MVRQLVTVEEVSRILKVRRETVRRYISRGYLRAVRLPGGDFRIRERDVLDLLSGKGARDEC